VVLCLDCDALRFELAQGGKTRKRVDVVAGDVRLPACGHQSAREYARSLPAGGIQYRNAVDEPGVVPRAPNFPLLRVQSVTYKIAVFKLSQTRSVPFGQARACFIRQQAAQPIYNVEKGIVRIRPLGDWLSILRKRLELPERSCQPDRAPGRGVASRSPADPS
jgi:hypothetical protein